MCSAYASGLDALAQLTQMQNEVVGQLPPTRKHTHTHVCFVNEEGTGTVYFPTHFQISK